MTLRFGAGGVPFAEFERRANGKITKKMEIVERISQDVMMDAANKMQRIVETEGVRNTIPNDAGRVESGAMARAVDFDVKRRANRVIARVGWLPGDPRRRKYFKFQDQGTYAKGLPSADPDPRPAPRAPRGIRPLLAAQRVHDEARDELQRRLTRKQK